MAVVAALGTVAVAQQSSIAIRDSEFAEDGATSITLSISDELDQPLTAADVRVVENGTAIEDVDVRPIDEAGADAPTVAVALVMDTSGSTEGEPLEAAKNAATGFLDSVADIRASVTVLEFNDAARVVTPLTEDTASLVSAISGLEAGGETALYDAVALAARELSEVEGQHTMVVFSDGADTASTTTGPQAIAAASAGETPITSVVLTSPDLDVAALQALANGTGGSTITVDSTDELAGAFEAVAVTLTNQYVVTYTSAVNEPSELNLEISVALPSGEATQSFTVLNPRRAPPEVVAPPTVERTPGFFETELGLVVGLGAAFLGLVALFMILVLTPRSRAARLLDRELQGYVEGSRRHSDPSAVAEALRRRASALLERSPSGRQLQSRVQTMLDQGALPLRTVELFAIMVVGGLLLGMIGLTLASWRGALVFAPVGIVAPWLFIVVRRNRRLSRFLEMLPDTLQLMAGSLSAGYGVLQAIDMVTKESEDPMSTEFNRVLVEARLGMPLEESLEAMADRMDSPDFRWVVLAMNIQREVGGNLAELMQTVATTLRNREALRRHINALSAEGKLSAIILVLLPIFLAGYLILVNPEYVGTLVESLVGWVLIGIGAMGMVIGVFWIRSLIRAIEV